MECGRNRVEIYSINYDFIPTIPYSQKALWVQLKYPAPPSLRIGDTVTIFSTDRYFNPPPGGLRVIDIVGTRVVLDSREMNVYACPPPKPFAPGMKRQDMWNPWNHGWHWGYETRNVSDQPYADRNWTFGNGRPVSYMTW